MYMSIYMFKYLYLATFNSISCRSFQDIGNSQSDTELMDNNHNKVEAL